MFLTIRVVTVDENGLATAVGVVKATITVTAGEYERKINLFVVDGDGITYEAEEAELTQASIESNGKYVGGIDRAGAKIGFTVDGGEGEKVFLRIYTSVVAANRTTTIFMPTAVCSTAPASGV